MLITDGWWNVNQLEHNTEFNQKTKKTGKSVVKRNFGFTKKEIKFGKEKEKLKDL